MKKTHILSFNVVNKNGVSVPMKIGIPESILRRIGKSVIEEKRNKENK